MLSATFVQMLGRGNRMFVEMDGVSVGLGVGRAVGESVGSAVGAGVTTSRGSTHEPAALHAPELPVSVRMQGWLSRTASLKHAPPIQMPLTHCVKRHVVPFATLLGHVDWAEVTLAITVKTANTEVLDMICREQSRREQ